MNKRETSNDIAFTYITGFLYPLITGNSLYVIKEPPLAIKDILVSTDLYHKDYRFLGKSLTYRKVFDYCSDRILKQINNLLKNSIEAIKLSDNKDCKEMIIMVTVLPSRVMRHDYKQGNKIYYGDINSRAKL